MLKLVCIALISGLSCTTQNQATQYSAGERPIDQYQFFAGLVSLWNSLETQNQLNHSMYWKMYTGKLGNNSLRLVTDESIQKLANFIEQELPQGLVEHKRIQKEFIFLRWMSRILVNLETKTKTVGFETKTVGLDLDRVVALVKTKLKPEAATFMNKDNSIYEVMSCMFKQGLWSDTDVSVVYTNLQKIYSEANLTNSVEVEVQKWNKTAQQDVRKSLNAKHQKWTQTISLLETWPQKLNLEEDLKDKLSWFTSDVISIEAKRAVIRALLTKIRTHPTIQNNLTSERYVALTGKVKGSDGDWFGQNNTWKEWWDNSGVSKKFKSWGTYVYESFKNSKELENDTKQDGYLDQVITLFLLFVNDILKIEMKVGSQRDSDETEQVQDLLPTGYGSIGYSKQDINGRPKFVQEVNKKLNELLPTDQTKSVIIELKEPGIAFELTNPKVYYLAELANVFYQFISAEMAKAGENKLTDDQFKDATTEGSYIQRQEEYNLHYLRKWFIRTRSVHPIISWLFQNYNPHMSQKISFSARYWYSYSFMSDWVNFCGGDTMKKWINDVLDKLGTAGQQAKQFVLPYFKSQFTK